MGVETFYFCSDPIQLEDWWNTSISKLILSLEHWRVGARPAHWALLTEVTIEEQVIPQLRVWEAQHGPQLSLRTVCQQSVAAMSGRREAGASQHDLRILFNKRNQSTSTEQLIKLAATHSALAQAARVGKANLPADTRVVDTFFSEWLRQFLPDDIAVRYDGSITGNSHALRPAEFDGLATTTLDMLNNRLNVFVMDAAIWMHNWQALAQIEQLWDLLSKALDRAAVKHLQAIGDIAACAVQDQLIMLKVIV